MVNFDVSSNSTRIVLLTAMCVKQEEESVNIKGLFHATSILDETEISKHN